MNLPKVIATSVVRSTQQGESHGGIYLVDLESGEVERKIDWNDGAISWEGRGGDRGLRGIALHENHVYLAASDEIFVYDTAFRPLTSYRNRHLKKCHEITIADDKLYLTSTALNSILEFDLAKRMFGRGYLITRHAQKSSVSRLVAPWLNKIPFAVKPFDCNQVNTAQLGSPKSDLHLNNVTVRDQTVLISGIKIDLLLALNDESLGKYAPLPLGTHNATAFRDGLIYNDTRRDRIVIADRTNRARRSFAVPNYEPGELLNAGLPQDHARQSFARGLCLFGDDLIVGGSSPSTITAYRISTGERLKSINISKDIRNCIHGLEIWPH